MNYIIINTAPSSERNISMYVHMNQYTNNDVPIVTQSAANSIVNNYTYIRAYDTAF